MHLSASGGNARAQPREKSHIIANARAAISPRAGRTRARPAISYRTYIKLGRVRAGPRADKSRRRDARCTFECKISFSGEKK